MMRDYQCVPFVLDDAGHEIYVGETAYYFAGRTMCEDCLKDEVIDMLDNNILALADMIGAEPCLVDSDRARGHR